ncbi:ASCH domain-containing protein [Dendrosporobacter sp. 1207_IL3150]|uniref:ASCH domain-containing protein n=1 Tax=Dendrosporobacter sp. 1207_IL3150 TaxID=3084054 RepID=UPI002FD96077
MFALNFISAHNEKILLTREKTTTIRLGDKRDIYPENSIVWITFGNKYGPKKKLYKAIIDRVLIKPFSEITKEELRHQNPDVKTIDELVTLFEKIYERKIYIEDTVSVIHFSEIVD